MSRSTDILVVGAGPTGLTLALQAHDHGARVRIVDRRTDIFRPSRALILHPRTLEVLRPLGVTDALLTRANRSPVVQLHLGRRVVHASLPAFALPDTAFPFLSLIRQLDVETVLLQALEARGIAVEWGTEAVEVNDGVDRASAVLRSKDGLERTSHDVIVGCDGPESLVRRSAGIDWRGAPYREEVVLADVELADDLPHGMSHVAVGRAGLLFAFALGEQATWRILATRPAGHDLFPPGQPCPGVEAGELQALLDQSGLGVKLGELVWSARYQIQHRLATRFRQGRLFIAGDAAHVSSPAGGQGMNTGIQDAINLGWKLAFADNATNPELLLDSYDVERRAVARQVLALTHFGFWAEAGIGALPAALRGVLAPRAAPLLPFLLNRRRLAAEVIRLLGQLRLGYPGSPLSADALPRCTPGPHAGRRLPDIDVVADGSAVRLHALLAKPGVHLLLGRATGQLECACHGSLVTVHRLSGIPDDCLLAIRPDGYVGFRGRSDDRAQLQAWLASIGAC